MSKSKISKGKLVRKFGENIFGNPKFDNLLISIVSQEIISIYLYSAIDINPCCPTNTSLNKLQIPTHIIGLISTPPIGDIQLLIGTNKNSVGKAIKNQGNRFISA